MIIMIPARIGSKGIPKKVLRPFQGKPLISWSIEASLLVPNAKVFVNTDGNEIERYVKAKHPNAEVFKRDESLSGDLITLDELCLEFVEKMIPINNVFLTIQPTSPFVTKEVIAGVAKELMGASSGSVITVTEKRKLTWKKTKNGFQPQYKERQNRQLLEPIFEENGAVLACYSDDLKNTKTRVNEPINCFPVDGGLSYDIDTSIDWRMASEFSRKRNLVAVFIANKEFGSGHFHRTLNVLHYLPDYEITLIGLRLNETYKNQCINSNYTNHFIEDESELLEICKTINPGLIMLDILNTNENLIKNLKITRDTKIVSFEDNGSGSGVTDLTINELYPSITGSKKILCGPEYSFLREEFDNPDISLNRDIDILISFGGTDPNDLTIKTLTWLANSNMKNYSIIVILGLGASRQQDEIDKIITSKKFKKCKIYTNVENMALLMCRAKIAVTASGRTIYELASCKVETICICQNTRQLTHLFVSEVNGIINLGYFKDVTEDDFIAAVKAKLSSDINFNNNKLDLSKSKKNVLSAIRNLNNNEI